MKSKKNQRIIRLCVACLGMVISACTRNFEEINSDPIRPSTVNQGTLLGQVQYRMVNTGVSRAKSFTHELMQVTAPRESSSGGFHRYEILPSSGGSIWDGYYARMTDLEDIYRISAEAGHRNYQAIALILKAWAYSILTDSFGDVPFSEAVRADEGIVTPTFDNQKDIYLELLSLLEQANDLIDTNSGLLFGGDMIYGADNVGAGDNIAMRRWKKFANSLRLRLLLRIIKRDGEVNVRQEIQKMLADKATYPVFESNDDEAIFRYPGTYPYYNPFYNSRALSWNESDYYTIYFLGSMLEVGDPRVDVWATKVNEGGTLIYRGIRSGYTGDVVYTTNRNSSYPANLMTSPLLGVIMTYSELEFIMAELALRGFDTGNTAKSYYENGIRASMRQWQTTISDDYLNQAGIYYDEGLDFEKQLEKIINQKYYAFYFVDQQAWFEKRRTGYPVLPRGEGIPPENRFPSRFMYPTYLQSLNPANLQNALTALGGKDDPTVAGWWEKN